MSVRDFEDDWDEEAMRNEMFADPGGRSALRAAGPGNPRNLPCPTCGKKNRLTPKDRMLGYQCDECADRAEGIYVGSALLMTIPLHPTKGVNPSLAICPRCGKDNGEIVLMGSGGKWKCLRCDAYTAAYKRPDACGRCGATELGGKEQLDEYEKVAGGLCNECEAELKVFKEEVEAGGVYFECEQCGLGGVVRRGTPLAVEVRQYLKLDPPAPCGVSILCKDHEDMPAGIPSKQEESE